MVITSQAMRRRKQEENKKGREEEGKDNKKFNKIFGGESKATRKRCEEQCEQVEKRQADTQEVVFCAPLYTRTDRETRCDGVKSPWAEGLLGERRRGRQAELKEMEKIRVQGRGY